MRTPRQALTSGIVDGLVRSVSEHVADESCLPPPTMAGRLHLAVHDADREFLVELVDRVRRLFPEERVRLDATLDPETGEESPVVQVVSPLRRSDVRDRLLDLVGSDLPDLTPNGALIVYSAVRR